MVGGGLMSPGWPSQSLEGTGIGPACGALWLNSAAWELKPMQVPKVPFGIFSLQSPGQATRDFPGDGDMQEPRGGIRKVSPLPRPLWPCPSVQMFRTSVPQTPPTPRGYYPQRLLPLGHSTVQAGFTRRIHSTFGLESFLPLT